MNRAKEICLMLSETPEYAEIRSVISSGEKPNGEVLELTELLQSCIDDTVLQIKATHPLAMPHASFRSYFPQDKVVEINMGQFLDALKRHSQNYIPEWYSRVDEKVFDYR